MTIVARRATRADQPLLVRGNQAMARETEGLELDLEVLARGVARVFEADVGASYLLAEVDGEVAGQLMITIEWSDWRACPVWWIQSVYVWPAHRRQGVYRALYAWVIEAAREAGAGGVRLYVDRRNTRAQGVYRQLGMDGEHYLVFEQMLPAQ